MEFSDIYDNKIVDETMMSELRRNLQFAGPCDASVLEILAHIKEAEPALFQKYEESIISAMGLFFKRVSSDGGIMDCIQNELSSIVEARYGAVLTPVQISILSHVRNQRAFSFSAPTSSGKSHVFRELISKARGDVVIVLPNRALIQEYMTQIQSKFPVSEVVVTPFMEKVNTSRTKKHVYVITPERGAPLFTDRFGHEISLFLFDEAQLSDSRSKRGYIFDGFVMSICAKYINSKIVFSHPFVENPEAQLIKYKIGYDTKSYSAYAYMTVAKLFVAATIANGCYSYSYFSPYGKIIGRYHIQNDIIQDAISSNRSVLIFVSKTFLSENRAPKEFSKYIELCNEVTDEQALSIIKDIEGYMGANIASHKTISNLVNSMHKGIVYHHGSMPLKIRSLVELFIRKGYCRLCFATSTLLQGINMPFSIVFVKYYKFASDLELRNLIGRAGRSTKAPRFDYGTVVVMEEHVNGFARRLARKVEIRNKSVFDQKVEEVEEDHKELVKSIQTRTYDYEYNLPTEQLNRLSLLSVFESIRTLLNLLLPNGKLVSFDDSSAINQTKIECIFNSFYRILQVSYQRKLTEYESSILRESIPIYLQYINGKSLRSIVMMRLRNIDFKNLNDVVQAYVLPCSNKLIKNLFFGKPYDFDALVFDTYDYIDKVITFSIAPPLCAALSQYHQKFSDARAEMLSNYTRYGTNDTNHIELLKYGFTQDEMEWLLGCVDDVDSSMIKFNSSIDNLSEDQLMRIQPFM